MLIFKKYSPPKIKYLLGIMLPIIATQASLVGMNFFDTVMSGNYSSADLAGVAVGSNIWMIVLTTISGILMASMTIIANLLGEGNTSAISDVVRKSLVMAIAFNIAIIAAGIILLSPILEEIGLEPEVYHVAKGYLIAIGCGSPAALLTIPLRSMVDAMGFTNKSMKIYLIALPFNAILNYCFIFGAFGVPAFGGIGAGITTAITYWILFLMYCYIVVCTSPFNTYQICSKNDAVENIEKEKQLTYFSYLKMGLPLGLSVMLETSIFGVTAGLVAKFGTVALAAHQAAINFASMIYMIPLSFSLAANIIIGYEYGARNMRMLKMYTRLFIELSCGVGIIYIILELIFCGQIAHLYSNDIEVIPIITNLIMLACIWQVGDMLCAPMQGITRGIKDMNATLMAAVIAFWVICLPLGFYIDYYHHMGVYSYWISLDIGALTSAIVMFFRLRHDMKRLA
ncbi:MAG: MATE family efflux transporter [Selenomonadaceae bacterium]